MCVCGVTIRIAKSWLWNTSYNAIFSYFQLYTWNNIFPETPGWTFAWNIAMAGGRRALGATTTTTPPPTRYTGGHYHYHTTPDQVHRGPLPLRHHPRPGTQGDTTTTTPPQTRYTGGHYHPSPGTLGYTTTPEKVHWGANTTSINPPQLRRG